ncbi:MAG: tripartite tricarboxylate transporter substrate binding protein [Pelistega sp.]|nr:tripartite tricarboxylate transporter substrate binding protein [Pelistega sp.]
MSKKMQSIGMLCLGIMACASMAQAQENWPTQTVKTVVSFSAGGTTDIIAREIGVGLGKLWNQSVVVENRPGAAGNIGTQSVVRAAPDGYTLLVNSVGPIAINPHIYTKTDFDTVKDLQPIILIADVPNVLVVASSLNIKTAEQLGELVRDKPEEYNCASTGVGTGSHLSCELMARTGNLKLTHIPYKGADALNDVLSGRVQFMFATLPSVSSHIASGKLIPLAVSTANRSAALKDVPTMQEAGFKGFEMSAWFGYFAPAKTPRAIIDKINKDINAVIQEPDLKAKLSREGAEPIGGTVEFFTDFVKSESDKWKAFTKELDIIL